MRRELYEAKSYPLGRSITAQLYEVTLNLQLGRKSEAERLMKRLCKKALKSPRLIDLRQYFHVQASLDKAMDRNESAFEHCLLAIETNQRLADSKFQKLAVYYLQEQLAEICAHLMQYEKSL